MFENVQRRLEELGRTTVSVRIDADADGYLDRECPAENCRFEFKVLGEDWSSPIFGEAAVFCPQCRHEAPSHGWDTPEQIEHAEQMAFNTFENAISDGLRDDAETFNRTQPRTGMVRMSMTYTGPAKHPVDVPTPVAELLTLKLACDACRARFAVVGTAFFCPGCGENLVERVFDDAMRKIRAKIDARPTIEAAVTASHGRDDAALLIRSLVESGLQDAVTAFQSFAAEHYRRRFPPPPPPPKNVFQRLTDGSQLWAARSGRGYDAWLDASELALLNVLFQRRHLLAHKDGKVDEEYLAKTADPAYRVEQRLVVTVVDVAEAVSLVDRLVHGLRSG